MENCLVFLHLELLLGILRLGADNWLEVLEFEAQRNLDVLYSVMEVLLNASKCYRNIEEQGILRRIETMMRMIPSRGRVRVFYRDQIRTIGRFSRDVFTVLGFSLERVISFYQLPIAGAPHRRHYSSTFNAYYKCIKNYLHLMEEEQPVAPALPRGPRRRPIQGMPFDEVEMDADVVIIEQHEQVQQAEVEAGAAPPAVAIVAENNADLALPAQGEVMELPFEDMEAGGGADLDGNNAGARNRITHEEIAEELEDIISHYGECPVCRNSDALVRRKTVIFALSLQKFMS